MSDYTNTPIGSGYNTNASINTELSAVETAVNSKLDKSGGTMTGELDMNSKKIINLSDATTLQEPVTYGQMINGASFAAADAKYFDTVALATADTTLAVGDVVIIEERANGIFDVISGTGTANTYNIIAHGSLSLSLELRVKDQLNCSAVGADGLADSAAAIQAALSISNNVLIDENSSLTSSQITIASNQSLVIDGTLTASINLATALITNSDTVGGNENIRLTGKGTIDGNKSNQASGDTYCVRFENVDESLIDIQKVQNCKLFTVPGNEGAIYLVSCTDTKVIDVESTANDATGLLGVDCVRCGSVRVHSHTNTASGVIWDKGTDNYSNHDHVHDNSFSNLNMTGVRAQVSFPNSYNSSFSNINFGESSDVTKTADDSVLIGGSSRGATLDGISIQRGDNITIIGTKFDANVRHNARVFGAAGKTTWLGVECSNGTGANTNGLLIEVGDDHFIGGGSEFHTNGLRGIDISGTVTGAVIDESVKCYDNGQVTAGNSAGIFLSSASSECSIAGEYFDTQGGSATQESGVWNGGGASHVYNGFYAHDNVTNQIRETSSPTLTDKRKVRLGLDPLHGSFTSTTGTTDTINNNNAQDVAKISVKAVNAAAVTLGTPFVNTFSSGVSFTVTYPSSAAGTEVYYYEIE